MVSKGLATIWVVGWSGGEDDEVWLASRSKLKLLGFGKSIEGSHGIADEIGCNEWQMDWAWNLESYVIGPHNWANFGLV